ncbi:phage major capsid protein [Priestia aryabhattai]|uniref:phage major capsid protein n=1 Tax=Priestia aryabhattai TaxID=412384 RepID=UPI001EBF8337|nr:phage major capsid protein [Priestia aryabhattai]MBY0094940.1 phage major capsid protein [Priestia aryabhattai]MBY0105572.1 phage major capsid protein [Priestia aryabhattai]
MKLIDELNQQITALETEVRSLNAEKKIDEAKAKLEEIRSVKEQIKIEEELAQGEVRKVEKKVEEKRQAKQEGLQVNTVPTNTDEYRMAWYKVLTGRQDEMTGEERSMMQKVMTENRSLTGTTDKDGGYTVPSDISQQIIESIKELNSVRNLVKVVPKKAPTGSYVVRKGTAAKLYNLQEKEALRELKNMEFEEIAYNVKKFGGFIPAPNELLADSFLDFVAEIKAWLVESSLVTENEEVLYGAGGTTGIEGIITSGKYKTIAAPAVVDIAFLRKVKNMIKQGYRQNAKFIVNTQAFELLSNLEDKNGRGYLAVDPRNEDAYTLFGRPVEIYDEVKTDEVTNKTHILFGDFQRAYFMFDRQSFEIKATDVGGDAYITDQTLFRGIERFDGKVIDPEALVVVTDVVVAETETV